MSETKLQSEVGDYRSLLTPACLKCRFKAWEPHFFYAVTSSNEFRKNTTIITNFNEQDHYSLMNTQSLNKPDSRPKSSKIAMNGRNVLPSTFKKQEMSGAILQ